MARYIEAEALKKHFPHDEDWDCPVNTNSLVCELIDAQPAADVIPVAYIEEQIQICEAVPASMCARVLRFLLTSYKKEMEEVDL